MGASNTIYNETREKEGSFVLCWKPQPSITVLVCAEYSPNSSVPILEAFFFQRYPTVRNPKVPLTKQLNIYSYLYFKGGSAWSCLIGCASFCYTHSETRDSECFLFCPLLCIVLVTILFFPKFCVNYLPGFLFLMCASPHFVTFDYFYILEALQYF